MQIVISNTGEKPIYEQICVQIKAAILAGELREGDLLPSMRSLAQELRISVITTKRAYEELEQEGFIVSQTGKGSFVAPQNMELLREMHLRQIEEQLQLLLELARQSGVTLEELINMLNLLYEA